MLKHISRILPFCVMTLLAVGFVELFYGLAERYLMQLPEKELRAAASMRSAETHTQEIEKHQNYDVIVERNLFRTYLEEQLPEIPVEDNPPEELANTTLDLVLAGTITAFAGRGRAIIYNKKERKQDLYYEGDAIEGAIIKEILRGKIILTYRGKDEILDMSEAASLRPADNNVLPEQYSGNKQTRPARRPRKMTPTYVMPGGIKPKT